MRQILRRFCPAMLVLLFCISLNGNALATFRASSYLTRYVAEAIPDSNGIIQVKISVGANKIVSELGASYILLEESDDEGKTWHVAREYEDESWMTGTNRLSYTRAIAYQGVIGNQYRVTADIFAKDNSGGDSRTTPTSPAVTAIR